MQVDLEDTTKAETIPPPGCSPDDPPIWHPRDFQLLLIAAQYCAAVQELLTWTFPSPLWDGAKAYVLQCTSALIAGRELPEPMFVHGEDGFPDDFPDWFAVVGRLTWANFTYNYFFGTHDLTGLPDKKPSGSAAASSKAAAGKAKAKGMKGRCAARGRGQGAAAAAAAGGWEGGGAAAEDAFLEMLPVAEQAYQWLLHMVGEKGWHPEGEVSQAIADWSKQTREWLDGSLGESWTQQRAAEAVVRNVSKAKPLKNAEADKPFFPIYPCHINSGNDNCVKCSLTTVRKKGASAAGTEDEAKMERSFPAGCCGLPAEYSQAYNCTLGFLVMSDVCEALVQATEGQDTNPEVTTFLYSHVLHHRTGAKRRKNVPPEHLEAGYPQLLASCVEGWERALAHVHTVWLPAALEAYLDATMSSPEDWGALEGGSAAGGSSAPGSAPRLARPPEAPKPQMVLPCCIPGEEILNRAEIAADMAAQQAKELQEEYQARVEQEAHRTTGPAPPQRGQGGQSGLQEQQAPAAAAVGAPHLQLQAPQNAVWAMAADIGQGVCQLMQGMQLGQPEPAAQAVGAGGHFGADFTPLPKTQSMVDLAERLRLALLQDTERCQQQAGAMPGKADEAALAAMFVGLEQAISARKSVMRLHSCAAPGM